MNPRNRDGFLSLKTKCVSVLEREGRQLERSDRDGVRINENSSHLFCPKREPSPGDSCNHRKLMSDMSG